MITEQQRLDCIEALEECLSGAIEERLFGAVSPLYGVCGVLGEVLNDPHGGILLVKKYVGRWEHYSGDPIYPVPCPDGGCPEDAFDRHHSADSLWDPSSEYGRLRLDLCKYMIRRLRSCEEVSGDDSGVAPVG